MSELELWSSIQLSGKLKRINWWEDNQDVKWTDWNWNGSSCGPVTGFCLSGVEPSGSNFGGLLVSVLLNNKLSVTVDNKEDWKDCFPLSSSHLFTKWTRHLVFSVPGKCSFLSYLICFVHLLCQAFCFEWWNYEFCIWQVACQYHQKPVQVAVFIPHFESCIF